MPNPDEPAPSERRSALERLLAVFTRVEAGEGISAVLLTLSVAVLAGALGLGIRSFAVANLVLIVGWLFLARALLKERKALREMTDRGEVRDAAAP